MNNPLFRLTVSAAAILVVVTIARLRKLSFERDLGLRWPDLKIAAAWIAGWIVWMIVAEMIYRKLGMVPERWQGRSGSTLAVLFASMVVLAPLAEELVFRGLVYWRLSPTAAGPIGAIVIAAVIFAAIHYQYGPKEWLFILIDGLLLGLARHQSGSLYVPIVMHMLGNFYAFYQRMPR